MLVIIFIYFRNERRLNIFLPPYCGGHKCEPTSSHEYRNSKAYVWGSVRLAPLSLLHGTRLEKPRFSFTSSRHSSSPGTFGSSVPNYSESIPKRPQRCVVGKTLMKLSAIIFGISSANCLGWIQAISWWIQHNDHLHWIIFTWRLKISKRMYWSCSLIRRHSKRTQSFAMSVWSSLLLLTLPRQYLFAHFIHTVLSV